MQKNKSKSTISLELKGYKKVYNFNKKKTSPLNILQLLRTDFAIPDNELIIGIFNKKLETVFSVFRFYFELENLNKTKLIILTKIFSNFYIGGQNFKMAQPVDELLLSDTVQLIVNVKDAASAKELELLNDGLINYSYLTNTQNTLSLVYSGLIFNDLKLATVNDFVYQLNPDPFLFFYLKNPKSMTDEFQFIFSKKDEKILRKHFLPKSDQSKENFSFYLHNFALFYKGLLNLDELSQRIVSILHKQLEGEMFFFSSGEITEQEVAEKRYSGLTLLNFLKQVEKSPGKSVFTRQKTRGSHVEMPVNNNNGFSFPAENQNGNMQEIQNVFATPKEEDASLSPRQKPRRDLISNAKFNQKRYSEPTNFQFQRKSNQRLTVKTNEESFIIDGTFHPFFMTNQLNLADQKSFNTSGQVSHNNPRKIFGRINNKFFNLDLNKFFVDSKIDFSYREAVITLLQKLLLEKNLDEPEFEKMAHFIRDNFEQMKDGFNFYLKTKSTGKVKEFLARNGFKNISEIPMFPGPTEQKRVPKIQFAEVKKLMAFLLSQKLISEFLHDKIYDMLLQNSLTILGIFEAALVNSDYLDLAESLGLAYDFFFWRSITSIPILEFDKVYQKKEFEDLLQFQHNIVNMCSKELELSERRQLSQSIEKGFFYISYAFRYFQIHNNWFRFISDLKRYCETLAFEQQNQNILEEAILIFAEESEKLSQYFECLKKINPEEFTAKQIEIFKNKLLDKEPNSVAILEVYLMTNNVEDFYQSLRVYFKVSAQFFPCKSLFAFMELHNFKSKQVC